MSWSSSREKAEDLLPPPALPAAAWGAGDASGSEGGGGDTPALVSDPNDLLNRTSSSVTVDEIDTGQGQPFWSEGLSVSATPFSPFFPPFFTFFTPFLLLMAMLALVVSPPVV